MNFSCQMCRCEGHADICDQRTGACIDCRDLTEGHNCERCIAGYYGDPRLGRSGQASQACRPCPCPGGRPRCVQKAAALIECECFVGPSSGLSHADTCYLKPSANSSAQDVVCNCRCVVTTALQSRSQYLHVFQPRLRRRALPIVCAKLFRSVCGCEMPLKIAIFFALGNPNEIAGSCERCDCSGNIDESVPESCDSRTGVCLHCLHNTAGEHCEVRAANMRASKRSLVYISDVSTWLLWRCSSSTMPSVSAI